MRNRYQPPTVRVALAAITSATLFLFVNASSVACPFCAKLTRSFADEVRESAVVIHGTLFEPGSDPSTPGTRVRIRSVIKGENLSLGDEISLNETVAAARTKSLDRLIFGHLANGAISPTRLDNVSEQFVDYLLKSTSLKDPSASGRLAFFFTRLDDPDDRISQDAYAEFAKASFRATSLARKHFEPAKLRAWLDDAQTPPRPHRPLRPPLGTLRRPR